MADIEIQECRATVGREVTATKIKGNRIISVSVAPEPVINIVVSYVATGDNSQLLKAEDL